MNKLILLFLTLSSLSCNNLNPHDPNPGSIEISERLSAGTKICVIGDSGKASTGQALVAEALKNEACDQVRHTGDIIYPNGLDSIDDPEFDKRFYSYYKDIMDAGVPFFMAQGNHDYKKNPSVWLDLAKKFEMIKAPSLYYANIYGDLCFVTIDTNSKFKSQDKWIRNFKSENSKRCNLTVAFGHHPRYSSGKHGNAQYFVKLFLKYSIVGKFDGYIAGHEHNQEDYGIKKGTHHLISGGAGEFRFMKKESPVWAEAKLGYLILTVDYENDHPTLPYEFVRIDENTGDRSIVHTGKLMHVSNTKE